MRDREIAQQTLDMLMKQIILDSFSSRTKEEKSNSIETINRVICYHFQSFIYEEFKKEPYLGA